MNKLKIILLIYVFIYMNIYNTIVNEAKKIESDVFNELSKYKYNGLFSEFTQNDLKNIIEFLNAVTIRTYSGTGENISKKTLRDKFFKTPENFRILFEQKPTSKLWRGDQFHPCDEKYPYNLEQDYYLQSFTNKETASFFGEVLINNKEIKEYKGSFSTTIFNKKCSYKDILYLNSYILYNEYIAYPKLFKYEDFYVIYTVLLGYGTLGRKYKNYLNKFINKNNINFYSHDTYMNKIEILDDENEIMFFDVLYKCNIQ
jgi:hypothetical protein